MHRCAVAILATRPQSTTRPHDEGRRELKTAAISDWDDALDRLPVLYGEALRLARAGFAPHAIAARLEVPHESLASVLALAEAKLAVLQASVPNHEQG